MKQQASVPTAPSGGARPAPEPPRLVFSRDDALGRSDERPQMPPSILVVEDDFLIAMEIEAALTDAGFALAGVAASAEAAVELAHRRRPTLAIMDIRLTGARDGVDAALDLYRSYGVRSIFATAHYDQEVTQRAKPAMPLAWLQKPYTAKSLVEAVRTALRELDDLRQ